MSPRKIVFDQPRLSLSEPVRPPPAGHRCSAPGCRSWAFYGFREPGIVALRQPVQIWTCSVHRPETL